MSDPVARACPACGLERSHFAFTAAGFVHVRCSRCATLFVAELPPPERVEATYLAPDYHSSAEGQELRMRAEADARAQALRKFGCRDVLEVGCGPGHFLDAVRELGMRVEGVDRARTAAGPRARGHTIHDCWLQDLAPVAARFDAVAMWEVIEHVPDPKDMLVHARKWLRPGGFLALSTPSSSGLPARALGARFPMVCPPDHLALFSRRGLNIGLGTPQYVIAIDAKSRRVTIGPREALACRATWVSDLHWLTDLPTPPAEGLQIEAAVQIRYRHKPQPAVIHVHPDGRCEVHFHTPEQAVTPGQAAVFYDGDHVLGGGFIAQTAATDAPAPQRTHLPILQEARA